MQQRKGSVYESFFDNSLEGIIIFDSKGKIYSANATAARLFECEHDSLQKANINDVIGEKHHAGLWKICHALMEGEGTEREKTLAIPDVGKKKVRLNVYLNNHIRSDSGPLIAAIIRDETKRFRDREEVKQSHERFKKTFNNSPVAQLIVCLSNGKIIDANPKFLELFRLADAGVPGKKLAEIGISLCDCANAEDCQPGTRCNEEEQCEKVVAMGNGAEITVLRSYVKIVLDGVPHQLWTFVDLTAQKAAERRLSELNERLEQKVEERTRDLAGLLEREKALNDLKSRFVAMASHEFRTPLTTVLVSAGLLETYIQQNEPEKCARHLTRIKSSVNLLTEILEDFLSLDKIEQAKVKPFVTSFELEHFAEKVRIETEATLRKGQRIECSITGGSAVKQDINILTNIMLNLLSNASKYSGEGEKIDWVIKVQPKKMIVSVSDKGIGIPIDDQPHIFSRFFRARNAEVIQGTGLGLHIVRKYVELLHGNISFTSTEYEGTTFTIELPLEA